MVMVGDGMQDANSMTRDFIEVDDYATQLRAADSISKLKGHTIVLVEDKASGQSLVQELKRDTKIPIIPINADKDKVARANAITPLCESGRVYLPEGVS